LNVRRRVGGALATVGVIALVLLGGPAGAHETLDDRAVAGITAPAGPALPECRYRDELTRYRRVGQWRKTLLDTNLKVTRTYRPRDLVSVSRANIPGSGQVRELVIDDLRAMARAARLAGAAVAVRSAYRSYAYQVATFAAWVDQVGLKEARKVSARPGHSEHQLGTTIDVRSASSPKAPWDYADWGRTKPGRWMKANAWRYGFLLSYPKGQRTTSCYRYEPWHFRYVGRTLARRVHRSGEVPRAYLWTRFETAP
jgi:D-alanyl-D-alanine carboxypeptidase